MVSLQQTYQFGKLLIPGSCVFLATRLSYAFTNIKPVVPGRKLIIRPSFNSYDIVAIRPKKSTMRSGSGFVDMVSYEFIAKIYSPNYISERCMHGYLPLLFLDLHIWIAHLCSQTLFEWSRHTSVGHVVLFGMSSFVLSP